MVRFCESMWCVSEIRKTGNSLRNPNLRTGIYGGSRWPAWSRIRHRAKRKLWRVAGNSLRNGTKRHCSLRNAAKAPFLFRWTMGFGLLQRRPCGDLGLRTPNSRFLGPYASSRSTLRYVEPDPDRPIGPAGLAQPAWPGRMPASWADPIDVICFFV